MAHSVRLWSAPHSERLLLITLVIVSHLAFIGWISKQPSQFEPPVPLPTMVGLLVAPPVPQPVERPSPVVKPKPIPPKPLPVRPKRVSVMPIKPAPPSERALSVPKAVPEPTPLATTESVPVVAVAPVVAPALPAEPAPVTPPRVDATQLTNPAPTYPPLSRRLGEQGQVVFDVYILADGTVGEIKLKKSSGYARLDTAAHKALQQWRYIAARRGEVAIPYWYVQPILFTLQH